MCFGSNALGNRGRVRQVTEQHGDLFPFAFEGTPGGQNFLGKVFGGVGQGFSCLVSGWQQQGVLGLQGPGAALRLMLAHQSTPELDRPHPRQAVFARR